MTYKQSLEFIRENGINALDIQVAVSAEYICQNFKDDTYFENIADMLYLAYKKSDGIPFEVLEKSLLDLINEKEYLDLISVRDIIERATEC